MRGAKRVQKMGTIKFTDKFLKGAKPAPGEGTTRFWDSETMGLCVAVGKRARTFYVKAGGKMYKIGGWPQWTLYEARTRAQEIRRIVDAGEDPTPRSTVMTIREAFEEFERSRRLKGRGDRTLKDYRSQMERYVFPKWGRTPVDRLTRPEVASLHDRIRATGLKTRGNRVLATISSLYGWLQRERDYKGVNPATGIERTQEHGREIFLQPDQVARLKTALQEYAEDVGGRSRNNDVAADAIWFCLVTGARSGEVKRATWDQFDPALTVWVKPASTTKQRKLHRVPAITGGPGGSAPPSWSRPSRRRFTCFRASWATN